jgi:signal transduction histidine kinase
VSEHGNRRRPHVLVGVREDEAREWIVATLRAGLPGSEIQSASAGNATGEALRAGRVDVLISDLDVQGLPDDGSRSAQDEGDRCGAYVIALVDTAAAERPLGPSGRPADDFVLKPARGDELVMRVRAGLQRAAEPGLSAERTVELERLVARQSEFLSMVSHEIRTPLSAIQSSANILLRYSRQRPESVERFARVIHQEGQRLTRLINNLLDLAKIESGEVEWRFEPTPLAGILDRVRESFAAALGERSLRLCVDVEPSPLALVVDRDKLTQVLLNLVSNAVKHSPAGGEVSVRCSERRGGLVRIEVEDQGDGVPPEDLERIFERFQQLESGDERTGTGLGLAISRQIVEHHGGRIWAEAERATGALFVIELPAGPRPEGADGPV